MEWLTAFFRVEAKDEMTLSDPEGAILAPSGQILLADLAGRTVGRAALVPMPNGAYEVAKMAVAPEVQGRGLGRLLLEAAVAWAMERGGRRLYLESSAWLTSALRLYESAGFCHLSPHTRPVSPYARAEVFMEMLLDAPNGPPRV